MRTSSARLRDDSEVSSVAQADLELGPPVVAAMSESSDPAVKLEIPKFDATYAITAKIAGRVNAASVSEEELQTLLQERQRLLDKQFDETITKAESNRLAYVRWSLDRIEDARYGQELDVLESHVAHYERFLTDIQSLQTTLEGAGSKTK